MTLPVRSPAMLAAVFPALFAALFAGCGGGVDEPSSATGASIEAAPAPSRKSTLQLIETARAARELDDETALIYRVFALHSDPRLPEQYRGAREENSRSGTVEELVARWDTLSEATRQLLAPFRMRPTTAGSWLSPESHADVRRFAQAQPGPDAALRRPCLAGAGTWESVTSSVSKVRVWYDVARPADKVQAEATFAEVENKVWPKLITGLAFKPPLDDSAVVCDGGDGKLDVYIVAGLADRGATYPDTTALYQGETYIELQSGLAGARLKQAIAHEFMHSIQWAYQMAATQTSYGWMRDAMANWAVEAVYPGNAPLLAEASCHMKSTWLPLTSRASGYCSTSSSLQRDYGAYLLFQYIGRTMGNGKVRQILAATQTQLSGLDAIQVSVSGGLATLWPKYAKTLWNQAPVTDAGKPSFQLWDGQTQVPDLAPDLPNPVDGNLGGVSEKTIALGKTVNDVSAKFYHFTFSEAATRSLMFHNTFYPLRKAGKRISVQAMWRTEAGNWVEEDWTDWEWIGLCRDAKIQRVTDLVLVIASAERGTNPSVVAAEPPTLKRNNIGCWGFKGVATRTYKHNTWTGSTVVTFRPNFDYKFGQPVLQYTDAATGRLRVPISAPQFRNGTWSLVEQYSHDGCSYAINRTGSSSSNVLGGKSTGLLVINNFNEAMDPALRAQQEVLLGTKRGGYTADGFTNIEVKGTVVGPEDCGTQYTSSVGSWLFTGIPPGQTQVILANGHIKGSITSAVAGDSYTDLYTWDFKPLSEP